MEENKTASSRRYYRRSRTNATAVIEFRRNNKIKLINALGGKCQVCGYDKDCVTSYHFHHKDKTTKEFTISRYLTRKYEILLKEAQKCILVCSNCHSEIHDKEYAESRSRTIHRWQNLTDDEIEEWAVKRAKTARTYECKQCKKPYVRSFNTQVYCSRECRIEFARNNNPRLEPSKKKPEANKEPKIRKKRAKKVYSIECLTCHKPFEIDKKDQRYCSLSCVGARVEARKVTNRPSKEELEKLIATKPWTAIATTYGVSDNAVRKWARGYDIEIPKRLGYWAKEKANDV